MVFVNFYTVLLGIYPPSISQFSFTKTKILFILFDANRRVPVKWKVFRLRTLPNIYLQLQGFLCYFILIWPWIPFRIDHILLERFSQTFLTFYVHVISKRISIPKAVDQIIIFHRFIKKRHESRQGQSPFWNVKI